MDFVNALLIAITTLSGAIAFLFRTMWKSATDRIAEQKNELKVEREKYDQLRKSTEEDLERMVNSNIEVVKSVTSLLNETLNERK